MPTRLIGSQLGDIDLVVSRLRLFSELFGGPFRISAAGAEIIPDLR